MTQGRSSPQKEDDQDERNGRNTEINIVEKGEEEPIQAIEASEGSFNETEKKVNEIKKDIINIIGDEAIEVKKKLDAYGIKVNQFKTEFKSNLPYTYDENMSTM